LLRQRQRLKRQSERGERARAKQSAMTRTFGSTTLDDEDKLGLLQAVKANDVAQVASLADSGALDRLRNYQNHHGDSALILAAWYGHLEIVQQLLAVQADPDLLNCDGNPAINCAAYRGHLELVEGLLDADASVDCPDTVTGKTALIKAAYSGHAAVCEALLEAGADVDFCDEQGYTALAFAASFGHREALQVLLQAGAETNVQDGYGITPLIHAAARGDSFGVCALLEYGACAGLLDVEGKTARHYAESNGFHAIVDELTQCALRDPADRSFEEAAMDKMTTAVMTPRIAGGPATSVAPTWSDASAGDVTPRMTPRVPVAVQQLGQPVSMTPRVPLGGVDAPNGPRSGLAVSATRPITAATMCEFAKGGDAASIKYLTQKLCNLVTLLEQDTSFADHVYPKFSC